MRKRLESLRDLYNLWVGEFNVWREENCAQELKFRGREREIGELGEFII